MIKTVKLSDRVKMRLGDASPDIKSQFESLPSNYSAIRQNGEITEPTEVRLLKKIPGFSKRVDFVQSS